jgi:chromate transport protein ChrA
VNTILVLARIVLVLLLAWLLMKKSARSEMFQQFLTGTGSLVLAALAVSVVWNLLESFFSG